MKKEDEKGLILCYIYIPFAHGEEDGTAGGEKRIAHHRVASLRRSAVVVAVIIFLKMRL